jgi:hypothetical protein
LVAWIVGILVNQEAIGHLVATLLASMPLLQAGNFLDNWTITSMLLLVLMLLALNIPIAQAHSSSIARMLARVDT